MSLTRVKGVKLIWALLLSKATPGGDSHFTPPRARSDICDSSGGREMTWLLADQKLRAITDEIERQSDRGVGIVGGAFAESFLESALKSRIRLGTEAETKSLNRLLNEHGSPLSSFSAKIDLGLLLGLYFPEVCNDLHKVSDIRNRFAHIKEPLDFSDSKISGWCSGFWLPHHLFIVSSPYDGPRDPQSEWTRDDPKGRFILTIKLLVSVLHRSSLNPRPAADPIWGNPPETLRPQS